MNNAQKDAHSYEPDKPGMAAEQSHGVAAAQHFPNRSARLMDAHCKQAVPEVRLLPKLLGFLLS
jgi:hypothetical protein